ncbi:MAG: ABC transporter transmembrane domain-containing protein [Cumulibacter sp.]
MGVRERLGLPWFAPAETPYKIADVKIDEDTTARGLSWATIWAPRRYVIPGALLGVLHQLGEALVPVLAGLAIDNAIRDPDFSTLFMWLALLALDFAMLSISWRFGSRIGWIGMHAVRQKLRVLLAERLLDPRGSADRERLPGVSMSIASSDVDRLSLVVAIGVYPLGQALGVAFAAVVLLTISWPLGLGVLLGVPALLFLMDRAGEPLRRRSATEQQMAAAAAGRAADLMSGYRIIKGIRAEEQADQRYRSTSRDALSATLQARSVYGGYLGLVNLLTGLFIAAIGTAAGYLMVTGQVSIAELVTVAGLAQFIIGPLQALSTNFGTFWSRGLASADRVLAVLRDEPRHVGDRALAETDRPAELRIADDLCVYPGEFVVVRADQDAASELIRAVSIGEGEGRVTYGGEDVAALEPNGYRAQVLVAPHDAQLFAGSVLHNVTLERRRDETGRAALRASGHGEILHSDALNAEVGHAGERLSGGQRQRVALARAVAQDPPVLVLTEPTTAVDSVTEVQIAANLRDARAGRSTLVITGSPAFRAVADRIVDWPRP